MYKKACTLKMYKKSFEGKLYDITRFDCKKYFNDRQRYIQNLKMVNFKSNAK